MARNFQREPIDGNDSGVWGNPELIQNRLSLGVLTIQCYDDSGTLKATVGKVGLQDNSINGVCHNTTAYTISLASVTNSNWFKVEIQRTDGNSFNFVASDTNTGTDTDPSSIPTSFDSAYDPEKGGYYISSNYRTIAIGYKDSGGNLTAIINTFSCLEGYYGNVYVTDITIDIRKTGTISKNYSYLNINSNTIIGDNPGVPHTICFCDANTNGIIITLPTAADNVNRIIEFIRIDNDNAVIKIVGEGVETISGLDWLFMTYQYQRFKIICDGTNWYVLEGIHRFRTGLISRSDWTNVHPGTVTMDYDNLSGTFQVGEIVTGGTTGDTGIIIDDDGAGTMSLIMCTSGGIFQNNEVITGSWSGATADVNEPSGSCKNIDCNFVHNQNINYTDYTLRFLVSFDGTYTGCCEIAFADTTTSTGTIYYRGINRFQINTDNARIQCAEDGFVMIADAAGAGSIYDSENTYYEVVFERKF